LRTWSYVAPEIQTVPGVANVWSRGNVHTLAEEVPSAYHYVSYVDTDTEANAAIRWETGVRFGKGGLSLDCALHGLHRAAELRKDTVARRVGYAAPVFSNEPVEDRAPLGQALERADLVNAHEAVVAFHIRCEDCGKASSDCYRV
jgi:hypothetical protein